MSDDEDLAARVRGYAALADPTRLRIVDLLALSDASPAELQRQLGISSNLLAHHLRTLESAGVVSRRRSEGDRRRSYLTLDTATLHDLDLDRRARGASAARVVFVCTANTARSQLAAALWSRTSEVPSASAGTHPATQVAPGALATARRHALPLRQVTPRRLDDVLESGDYLVTVCDNAFEELVAGHRPADAHWSVPDPVPVDTAAAFDAAYDELARRVASLAPRLHLSDVG